MDTAKAAVGSLVKEVLIINPLQAAFLETSLRGALDSEIADLGGYISFCEAAGLPLSYLAKCYDLIVKDTLREQVFFQRHRRYRYSTFAEVANSVYFDDDYMRMYMHGLALTSCLWPNHRDIQRFFIEKLPRRVCGNYLEVGPGHGVYMMHAMRFTSYTFFEGIDLSPTSVALTKALLDSGCFGEFRDYSVAQQDFLSGCGSRESYDAIVMGEVLEHVESPLAFLNKIYRLATKNTFIFVTTAINAPAIDHIYLFDAFSSLKKLVDEAKLKVVDYLIVPYLGKSLEESEQMGLPINVALVLAR